MARRRRPNQQPSNPTLKKGAACECGHRLPWHLAELTLGDIESSHTCLCHRNYLMKDGTFIPNGFKTNPFALV